LLSEWDAPRCLLDTRQRDTVEALVRLLESTRGRQQRAGWGQSDSRWDLPFIGAWDVLYSTNQAVYGGLPSETLFAQPPPLLRTARQWVYGPGDGGLALECEYAQLSASGGTDTPLRSSILLTLKGSVDKAEGSALSLNFEPATRAFPLSYSSPLTRTLQQVASLRPSRTPVPDSSWSDVARAPRQADGQWGTVTVVADAPLSSPSVGAQLEATRMPRGLCAPPSGPRLTTYLSDVLWIVRGGGETAGSVGGGDGERAAGSVAGEVTVLRRTEAEALRPQNGDEVDGFDPRRFGPSGRRIWMFDTGFDEREEGYQRAKQRMRSQDEISGS
jgi:hypothetical protein